MSSLCIRTARLGVLELEPTGRHRGVHLNAGTDQVHPELSDGGLTSFTHFCQIPQGLLKVCFPELVSPLSLNCPLSFPTECPGAPSSPDRPAGRCRDLSPPVWELPLKAVCHFPHSLSVPSRLDALCLCRIHAGSHRHTDAPRRPRHSPRDVQDLHHGRGTRSPPRPEPGCAGRAASPPRGAVCAAHPREDGVTAILV